MIQIDLAQQPIERLTAHTNLNQILVAFRQVEVIILRDQSTLLKLVQRLFLVSIVILQLFQFVIHLLAESLQVDRVVTLDFRRISRFIVAHLDGGSPGLSLRLNICPELIDRLLVNRQDDIRLIISNPLQILDGDIKQKRHSTGYTSHEPDMGYRCSQADMPHSLSPG